MDNAGTTVMAGGKTAMAGGWDKSISEPGTPKSNEAEKKGRKGDVILAHLTPGEIVIPRALAENDEFRAVIAGFFKVNGVDFEQFFVGSGKNKINPKTGYMEFGWFKKAFGFSSKKFLGKNLYGKEKVLAAYGGAVIGFAVGGPAGAVIGASMGYSSVQQKREEEKAKKRMGLLPPSIPPSPTSVSSPPPVKASGREMTDAEKRRKKKRRYATVMSRGYGPLTTREEKLGT